MNRLYLFLMYTFLYKGIIPLKFTIFMTRSAGLQKLFIDVKFTYYEKS